LLNSGSIQSITFASPFVDRPILVYQFKSEDLMLNPTKEGACWRSDDRKSWGKRWLVLKGSYLYIFKSASASGDRELLLSLQGTSVAISEPVKECSGEHCFEVITRFRVYFFRCDEARELKDWLQCLNEARVLDERELLRTTLTPEKKGLLWKLGGTALAPRWQRRSCYMRWNLLYYYKSPEDNSPAGVIPLSKSAVDRVEMDRPHCFVVNTRHRNYFLAADSADEREQWLEAIRSSTSFDGHTATEELKLFNRLTQVLTALDCA